MMPVRRSNYRRILLRTLLRPSRNIISAEPKPPRELIVGVKDICPEQIICLAVEIGLGVILCPHIVVIGGEGERILNVPIHTFLLPARSGLFTGAGFAFTAEAYPLRELRERASPHILFCRLCLSLIYSFAFHKFLTVF